MALPCANARTSHASFEPAQTDGRPPSDLTEIAVRAGAAQAVRDAGTRNDDGPTNAERRKPLAELWRENRRPREDVDILKRATAFFAKETR